MKNRLTLAAIYLLFTSNLVFSQHSLDSLLRELDKSIKNSEVYSQQRESRITELKSKLRIAKPNSVDQYDLNMQLFKEYKSYVCDSAIHYLNNSIKTAQQLKDERRIYESQLKLAYLMGSTGMYKESIDFLDALDRCVLPEYLVSEYYSAYLHVYGELSYYTQNKEIAVQYRSISNRYRDSLNFILPADDEMRLIMRETNFRNMKNYTEARKLNDLRLSKATPGTPEYALITYHRALSYMMEGNSTGEKYYLALSALSDIQSATKDHASLWMLAQRLYQEGDLERAYNYIRFSWNETVFYNARLRSLQSAVILSLIDETYQATIERQKLKLQNYLILISALSILLMIASAFIFRQMKRLSAARKNLQSANNQLKKLNSELKQVNQRLQTTNIELSESNEIKEEYIGRFIKLCSTYIEKLDGYRRMVHKKLINGQSAELVRITRDQEALDDEFEELYANFDTAFLQLFPNFVVKINELLHEEERIVLKKGELLNTELRILALIRLGINDSSQIAEFLRYSVNTIYNYRAKVKNRAILREEFEETILKIR